jgi:hypothetical protein
VQRAPLRLFNDYKYLQFIDLTTNRAVGSSNLSGRAKNQKVPSGAFLFLGCLDEEENSCSTKRASVLDARSAPPKGVKIATKAI